jgi:hypothetical protein
VVALGWEKNELGLRGGEKQDERACAVGEEGAIGTHRPSIALGVVEGAAGGAKALEPQPAFTQGTRYSGPLGHRTASRLSCQSLQYRP